MTVYLKVLIELYWTNFESTQTTYFNLGHFLFFPDTVQKIARTFLSEVIEEHWAKLYHRVKVDRQYSHKCEGIISLSVTVLQCYTGNQFSVAFLGC
jgi:hypothetical protein